MLVLVLIAVLAGLLLGVFIGVRLLARRANRQASASFDRWRAEQLVGDQEAAIRRSRAVLRGQVVEQFAPLFEEFRYDFGDARFLGKPVDFIVFDGYRDVQAGQADELREIVFLDIKTGRATLSTLERRIKECVEAGSVTTWRPWPDPARTATPRPAPVDRSERR